MLARRRGLSTTDRAPQSAIFGLRNRGLVVGDWHRGVVGRTQAMMTSRSTSDRLFTHLAPSALALRILDLRSSSRWHDSEFLRNLDQIIGPPTVAQQEGDSHGFRVTVLRKFRGLSYKVNEGVIDPEFVQENREESLIPS